MPETGFAGVVARNGGDGDRWPPTMPVIRLKPFHVARPAAWVPAFAGMTIFFSFL